MPKSRLFSTSALRSALFVGFVGAMASPAAAQSTGGQPEEAPGQAEAPDQSEVAIESGTDAATEGDGSQTLVVTGSRIRRPNLESSIPITSVGGGEFFETGNIAIGDTLNELPQLRSTLGQQQSSTVGLGNAGLNLLDLRGLGTIRTLVLVNGRRHVAGDIGLNAASVDTNTIPTALIERVDVVTGGNSAIYGSDAIAGVVNFVLRRDFQGIEARGQVGISQYGDAAAYFGSLTAGQNFADGRGNVALSVEYGRQDAFYASGRPSLSTVDAFQIIDTDPAGSVNGSDGVPDTQFFRDLRAATTSSTGTIQFNFTPTATRNCGTDPVGAFYNCPYIFQPDGTLVQQTGTRVGLGPNGIFVGGNGLNTRTGTQLELAPDVDRVVANLIGRFEFSPAAEVFAEAKYAKIKSFGVNAGAGFIISAGNFGDVRQAFRLDNPFLSTQARSTITDLLLTTGRTTGTIAGAGGALSAADIAAINNGTFRVRFQKQFLDVGLREQRVDRETYRAVLGVRGTFNEDWNYELSANYGEFTERDERDGNLNRQRLLLALDAARQTPGGAIQCRSQFDPAARLPLNSPGLNATVPAAERAAILAADIAACVPLNPFGSQLTAEQADYITDETFSDGKITQFVLSGFMSGDSSEQFELPGGPIGFAMGLEYRRETAFFELDESSRQGYTVFNALATLDAEPFEVTEAFAEIRAPILRDVPFFHELTASAAGRYAVYEGAASATGGVFAYNAGLEWAPVRDVRFRGNYSRAVRAPLLTESQAGESVTFINPVPTDPCALRNRGSGTANRAANCLAAGVPEAYDFVYTSTPIGVSAGNPNLTEESSKSWSVGAVVQPRFVPGLSFSVDYFDIEVKDVITSVNGQTALNQCVDLPSLNNGFCALFKRNLGPGLGPSGEEVGRPIEGSFLISTLNFAKLTSRGIDVEAAYRRQIAGLGSLDLRLTYTHVLGRSNFTSPTDPTFENVILSEVGDPEDELLFRVGLNAKPVNFTYTLRYIGKQYITAFENYNSVNGLPPTNTDLFVDPFVPEVFYHNVRLGFDIGDRSEFYVGVDNATNKDAPLGFTGTGAGPAAGGSVGSTGAYDVRGRFFYAGMMARF